MMFRVYATYTRLLESDDIMMFRVFATYTHLLDSRPTILC